MKKSTKKLALALALTILVSMFSFITIGADFVPVTGLMNVHTEADVGGLYSFFATVLPSNATNNQVVWSLIDAGTTGATIVYFEGGEHIVTSTPGEVVVRATIVDGLAIGEDFYEEFTITFETATIGFIGVPTSGVVGTPLDLFAIYYYPDFPNGNVIEVSIANAGTTGATITGNLLNFTAPGVAFINVAAFDSIDDTMGLGGVFAIIVTAATDTFVPVTGITGVPTTTVAGTNLALAGTVAPANATNSTIAWTVYNAGTTGATINAAGQLVTTAAGTVVVRATITNGATATTNFVYNFTITVTEDSGTFVPVTGITAVPTTTVAGTNLALAGTIAPANATNSTIVWSVYNAGTTGATINAAGQLVTAAAGTVIVRATITNGATATTNFVYNFTITVTTAAVGSPDTGVPFSIVIATLTMAAAASGLVVIAKKKSNSV